MKKEQIYQVIFLANWCFIYNDIKSWMLWLHIYLFITSGSMLKKCESDFVMYRSKGHYTFDLTYQILNCSRKSVRNSKIAVIQIKFTTDFELGWFPSWRDTSDKSEINHITRARLSVEVGSLNVAAHEYQITEEK